MKLNIPTIFFLGAISLGIPVSDQSFAEIGTSEIKTEIERVAKEAATAYEDFPRTLDANSFLKFFAPDFSGVSDGKSQTLQDVEKGFADLKERIKLGEPIGFSYQLSDIEIHPFTDRMAWLTYQSQTKIGRGGTVVEDIQTKCSTLIRKEGEAWLIFHEHCSTVNEGLFMKTKRWRY